MHLVSAPHQIAQRIELARQTTEKARDDLLLRKHVLDERLLGARSIASGLQSGEAVKPGDTRLRDHLRVRDPVCALL
jgi:hypothetical protein